MTANGNHFFNTNARATETGQVIVDQKNMQAPVLAPPSNTIAESGPNAIQGMRRMSQKISSARVANGAGCLGLLFPQVHRAAPQYYNIDVATTLRMILG